MLLANRLSTCLLFEQKHYVFGFSAVCGLRSRKKIIRLVVSPCFVLNRFLVSNYREPSELRHRREGTFNTTVCSKQKIYPLFISRARKSLRKSLPALWCCKALSGCPNISVAVFIYYGPWGEVSHSPSKRDLQCSWAISQLAIQWLL